MPTADWQPCSSAIVVDGTTTNEVQIAKGQKLVITLKSNPTTGYSWQMNPTEFLSGANAAFAALLATWSSVLAAFGSQTAAF